MNRDIISNFGSLAQLNFEGPFKMKFMINLMQSFPHRLTTECKNTNKRFLKLCQFHLSTDFFFLRN